MQILKFCLWHFKRYQIIEFLSLRGTTSILAPISWESPPDKFSRQRKKGVNFWCLTHAFQCDLSQTNSMLFHIDLQQISCWLTHLLATCYVSVIQGMNLIPDVLPIFSNNGVHISKEVPS